MKNSKKDTLRRMQKEDALGISRRRKSYLHIDRRVYRTFKIVMAIALPVLFFLYSPALIAATVVYIVVVCIFNANAEREMNDNYRPDCHVRMPKYDVAAAVAVTALTIIGVVLSQCLSKNAGGMLGGFSSDELDDFLGSGKFPVDFSSGWFAIREVLVDLGSLMTGERSLFSSFRIGMQAPPSMPGGGFGGAPGGGAMPEISLSDLPLSFVFSTLFSVLNSILLFSVAALALLSLRGVRKVYRIAETGEGRKRDKLRFEKEEVRTVERDIEEIAREHDLLLKIFEDELLADDPQPDTAEAGGDGTQSFEANVKCPSAADRGEGRKKDAFPPKGPSDCSNRAK